MGKHGYYGTEVYITRLPNDTKFRVHNGEWEAVYRNDEGVNRILVDETIKTIPNDYIMTISTDVKIPFEAYVYKSAYYTKEFELEAVKLERLNYLIKNKLLNNDDLADISQQLTTTISNLKYLSYKFECMEAEEVIK